MEKPIAQSHAYLRSFLQADSYKHSEAIRFSVTEIRTDFVLAFPTIRVISVIRGSKLRLRLHRAA